METPSKPRLHALVLCRHEAVRRQLAAHLARSPRLLVTNSDVSPDALAASRPDVLLVDLSQVDDTVRRSVLAEALGLGTGVVALASIPSQIEEDEVRAAGGTYRLKEIGTDGLDEAIIAAALR